MKYDLHFHPSALKEWKKLNTAIKDQFKKILARRLINPRVKSAALGNQLKSCYKIKLRQAGYRLVYRIVDQELVVLVVAVGKRNKNDIYDAAIIRK